LARARARSAERPAGLERRLELERARRDRPAGRRFAALAREALAWFFLFLLRADIDHSGAESERLKPLKSK
jgi:hypothetical protein